MTINNNNNSLNSSYTCSNTNNLSTSYNNSNSTLNGFSGAQIPEDVDDFCSRFIIHIPQEERTDLIRVCFHIELAPLFYWDYYCVEQKLLPKVGFNQFAKIVFLNILFLRQHVGQVESVIEKWRVYKMALPTYGGTLLSVRI